MTQRVRLAIVTVFALGSLMGALPAAAMTSCSGSNQCCVDDVNGTRGANCTSNDVTFTLVGLGTQSDGCVDSSDTLTIFLGATVQNTTAQARYDIGMYIAIDGDPNGDGAVTGQCARERLTPASPTTFIDDGLAPTCLGSDGTLLDLLRTGAGPNATPDDNGYYLTAETGGSNSLRDACGDLNDGGVGGCDANGDGLWDESVMVFTTAVTVPCDDTDSDGSNTTSNDGFVNIPTCATWGNEANQVHTPTTGTPPNETCDSEAEVVNGTAAKCNCEDLNSNVPAPRLNLSCSCTPSTIAVGGSATCTVTYTNGIDCTPNLATAERFRCGAASFLRFRTDFNESFGTVSAIGVSGNDSAASVTESGNQLILWTPASGLGTSGIVAENESETLTFTYTATAPSTGALSFPTTAYWSNGSSFSPEVAQTTLTCSANLTTPVTLSSFESRREGRDVVVEWTTATEVGNAAFHLYEQAEDGWQRINAEPIAARGGDSTAPHRYRYRFESAGGTQVALEDLDVMGGKKLHGPFAVGEKHGRVTRTEALDWPAIRAATASALSRAPKAGVSGGPKGLELLVERDGLYRLSYEEIRAAGLDLAGAHPDHLAVVSRGAPVPIHVELPPTLGPRPERFGPGSFVEFYGEAVNSLYTDTNVYTLVLDRGQARRMASDSRASAGTAAASYLETLEVARNNSYSFGSPTADPWYDTRLLVFTTPARWSFNMPVAGYAPAAAPVTLEVEVWGSTAWPEEGDHHLRVEVNGVRLADEIFDGRVAHTVRATLPPGLLVEGANTLTLELPADRGVSFDLVNLEGYRLTYPRAFSARGGALSFEAGGTRLEVGNLPDAKPVVVRLDPAGPVRITRFEAKPEAGGFRVSFAGSGKPARYLVSSASALLDPGYRPLRSEVDLLSGRADYLVLTHGAFTTALAPLVSHHEASGLAVKVVEIDDVYHQYSHGIVDAAAIRAYLAQATRRLGVRYVLLVGADTYDPKDYLGLGSMSFIPTLYAETGNLIFFSPVDSLLADVDGDQVPDLSLGRLPVRTTEELAVLVNKTLVYATKTYGKKAVFAADLFDSRANFSFTRQSEETFAKLPPGWLADRAYLDRVSVADARRELVAAIERGAALSCFLGHSGPSAWTFSGLFSAADAAALTNAGAPTVVMQWGCWNTYFVEPRFNTLGHTFLLSGDRGAAAVMGSSTLLDTSSAEALAAELAPLLAQPGRSIGDAILAAKQALAAKHPERLDALLGWTLLGDPALVIEP
jgi:Peptidase family C25